MTTASTIQPGGDSTSQNTVIAGSVSDCGKYLSANLGRQFVVGNSIDILNNGQEIFPAMMSAIDKAEHHIEFQSYIYWDGEISDQFAECLAAAARRGVQVRILLDSFGAITMSREAIKLLEQNCTLSWFRPLYWVQVWRNVKRSHRKILVCDGKVGFTGGVGIGQQWTGGGAKPGEWRDIHFRLQGPIIYSLQAAFLENWLEALPGDDRITDILATADIALAGDESIMPLSSTASDFWSSAGTLIFTAVASAHKKLRITTPYFVTDKKLVNWILQAQDRGVDVQIIIPAFSHSDSRLAALAGLNCVEPFLEAGIRIYTYQPTFVHSKCVIIDDEVAIVGSVNFNQRSLRKDDEFSLIIDKGPAVDQLVASFKTDREQSRRLQLDDLKKRYRYLGILARSVQPFRRHF